jgi:hypothetical protein
MAGRGIRIVFDLVDEHLIRYAPLHVEVAANWRGHCHSRGYGGSIDWIAAPRREILA